MAKPVQTKQTSLNWPDYYPPGVPPLDAVDTQGVFFRLVKVLPPQRDCFASTHEEYPNRHRNPRLSDDDKKNVYGASFFDTHMAAADAKEKFPNTLGDRLVAQGELKGFMGKMKKTRGPSHYTMWLKVDCGIHNHFA
jgi:hypothetical protein